MLFFLTKHCVSTDVVKDASMQLQLFCQTDRFNK